MIKGRIEFTNKYTLGLNGLNFQFKWIHFVQSLFSPCTSISTAPGLIGWWQVDIWDHLSCQRAVSFFNAIFLTNAHFSAGCGLRDSPDCYYRVIYAVPSACRHLTIVPMLLIRKPSS